MKIRYYPETDTLYIALQERPGADADEIAPDVVVDLAEDGDVVGIEIDHASKHVDLARLEADGLPVVRAARSAGHSP